MYNWNLIQIIPDCAVPHILGLKKKTKCLKNCTFRHICSSDVFAPPFMGLGHCRCRKCSVCELASETDQLIHPLGYFVINFLSIIMCNSCNTQYILLCPCQKYTLEYQKGAYEIYNGTYVLYQEQGIRSLASFHRGKSLSHGSPILCILQI